MNDEAWNKMMDEERRNYNIEKEQKAIFVLVKRLDSLKTNWYEWSCLRNGVEGIVQADFQGGLIAPETFEKD